MKKNLAFFSLGRILKKLNRIHIQINSAYDKPFPKPRFFWLSEYAYQRWYIKIKPDGRIVGGLARFISSVIDFSFIRSIVAHRYCTTIAGNVEEGKCFIVNREQILSHHAKTSKIDLADAEYDELTNHDYSRINGAIPVIDYNPRNENLSHSNCNLSIQPIYPNSNQVGLSAFTMAVCWYCKTSLKYA